MKTVTGKIVSSNPISVSKAATILSKFVSTDNGASQAVGAYLRRSTVAFDELVRIHLKSERRRNKKHKLGVETTSATEEFEKSELESTRQVENRRLEEVKKEKSKKEGNLGSESEKKRKKKKRKIEDGDD